MNIFDREMSVYAELRDYSNRVQVALIERRDGRKYVAKRLEMEELGEGLYAEPSFELSKTEAQMLMDQLWKCGLRPSEGSGSAGAMAATQKHLEDMRKIAFDRLKIK